MCVVLPERFGAGLGETARMARMAQTERRWVETWQGKSKLNEESSSIPSISFSG